MRYVVTVVETETGAWGVLDEGGRPVALGASLELAVAAAAEEVAWAGWMAQWWRAA